MPNKVKKWIGWKWLVYFTKPYKWIIFDWMARACLSNCRRWNIYFWMRLCKDFWPIVNFKSNFEIFFFSLTNCLDPRRPNGYLVAGIIITGEFVLIGLSIVGFVCFRCFKHREDWNKKKSLPTYLFARSFEYVVVSR